MISTLTARGRRPPRTARSGCRLRCRWAGRRIVTVAGHGLLPGAGPGWMTRLGDSLPSTTAAGCIGIARGPGLPDRSATGTRIMLRHWWAGSADLGSASASDGDGVVAWGVGVGFGWFPLGWGAPYYPRYCGWGYGGWYQGGGWVSNGYLRNVNVTNTNITNINNITNNYNNHNLVGPNVNRNIPGAVTAASKSAFTSGAAINKVGVTVPKSSLDSGQLMHTADVTPTRQ